MSDTVVCVMLTGGSADRRGLALRALKSWRAQTWRDRRLVVVNESCGTPWERPLLERPGEGERELLVPHGTLSTGSRRNLALEDDARWVIGWDDDDWSHPERLARLMGWRTDDDHCVAVTSHVRYCLRTRTGYLYSCEQGCGGIALYPRGDWRWADVTRGEDTELFLRFHAAERVSLCHNGERAHDYLRFHHGGNLGDRRHIMRQFARPKWIGKLVLAPQQHGLSLAAADYLVRTVAAEYRWWPHGDPDEEDPS